MKHARKDYGTIQDSSGRIPEDEPVFLLRAQDVTAPTVVRVWADLAEKAGAATDIVAAARAQVEEMRKWQQTHEAKIPDLPARKCRVCGCTDLNACLVKGVPCHWVGPDLCSACECTEENPCCDRRNEYNGYRSGRTIFVCPRNCSCHD